MADRANKAFWQRFAGIYAPIAESDKKFYSEISDYVRPYLKSDMAVLELACGSGQLSFLLAEAVREWTATDFSEKMLEQAEKRNKSGRICFQAADATALPFSEGSFDCVVIANALHIMPNSEQAMQEIQRVLKPGGLLYAPTFLWSEKGANGFRKKLMSLFGFRCYREWDRNSFRSFTENFGFHVMAVEMVDGGLAPVGVLLAEKADSPVHPVV